MPSIVTKIQSRNTTHSIVGICIIDLLNFDVAVPLLFDAHIS